MQPQASGSFPSKIFTLPQTSCWTSSTAFSLVISSIPSINLYKPLCTACSDSLHLLPATMSPDEVIYLAVLLVSIPIGFLFKKGDLRIKQFGGAAAGLVLTLATCHIHTLHSLITILGTWLIINISPRACHYLTLGWTFSYLLFFRTIAYFGFPEPTPFTNAVQLLLTLKMVSLANEVQELTWAKKQDVTSFAKSPLIGVIPKMPGLVEILCYSYCYVGLMTGPFFRYRTYHDWLNQPNSTIIPSWKPLLLRMKMIPIFGVFFLVASHFFPLQYVRSDAFYERGLLFRIFYMIPIFFVFRMRFYVAWLCAECACISAAFGAYPTTAKSRSGGGPTVEYVPISSNSDEGGASSITYDYETIKNIDPHGTDFCVKVKDGMRYWNMTVQWWLAQYIYKSAPVRSYVLR
ncbi:Membrane bound O-acyltransferase domain containing 7 [Podarcis lilfordi]|uniref:Leukocyte receptor cluster member 4 n=1 Tax=Podarcis lilfordi TaxID=74358 RepID=A0AA35L6P7_9SAUR|nr:Membrane bound O-acyltransferase domain containing 7 [Podarcis lilfordi]